jgi:type IX secretion system PorP/SprF family membrane protein
LWLTAGNIAAQDLHFSQFEQVPTFTNVGQTGLHSGDYRFGAVYRNQWFSVPVPYSTFGVWAEGRLMKEKISRDILAAGLLIVRDVAGDSRLSTTSIQASIGYSKRLTERLFLFGGAYLGAGQRRFSTANLQFDDQYDGERFNAGQNSADLANIRQTNFMYLDLGIGAGMRWQLSRRTFCNFGGAVRHLNQPMQRFMSGGERMGLHFSANVSASAQLDLNNDVLFSAQYQLQNPYQAIMFGGGWRRHLDQSKGREMAVYMMLSARWRDAFIPQIGFNYQSWQFGLSYDINLSNFNVATNRNGAVELTMQYLLIPVPKLGELKTCPIL